MRIFLPTSHKVVPRDSVPRSMELKIDVYGQFPNPQGVRSPVNFNFEDHAEKTRLGTATDQCSDGPAIHVPDGLAALQAKDMLVVTIGEQASTAAVAAGIPSIGLADPMSWTQSPGWGISDPPEDATAASVLLNQARRYHKVLILGNSRFLDEARDPNGLDFLAWTLRREGIRGHVGYCPPTIYWERNQRRVKHKGFEEWLAITGHHRFKHSLSALCFAVEAHASGGLTDSFNAQIMSDLFADQLSYSRGDWMVWDDRAWKRDTDQMRRKLVLRLSEFYRDTAEELRMLVSDAIGDFGNRDLPEALARWIAPIRQTHGELAKGARSIQNLRAMDAAFTIAQAHLRVASEAWDRDPHLLAVKNGVVDLRTGELYPHSPEFHITRAAGCGFDPNAKAPTFEKFFSQVQPDPEVRRYLQILMGYAATGEAREQKLFTFLGDGANGKSTFMAVVMDALGEYAVKANASLLAEQTPDRPRNDLAALAGARLVSISEIPSNLRPDAALIKSLTGGDVVTARFLHKEFFQFRPCFTPILDTNHPLMFRERSEAVARRAVTIPWAVTVAPESRDPNLRERLLDELPGILAWIVNGARMYYAQGLGSLPEFADTCLKTLNSVDPLTQWLDECVEADPASRVQCFDLYQAFREWMMHRWAGSPMTMKAFSMNLKARGYRSCKNSTMVWLGVRLRR